jgi:mRNA-degrading endonuclease RelE of RelBE toxin-antitoxin system
VEVFLSQDAEAQMLDLPPVINARVRKVFERLRRWPQVSGAKVLKGQFAGQFRVRTGDYRVQFLRLDESRLLVVKIGHRDGFYDD